jgi:hypothetical protein
MKFYKSPTGEVFAYEQDGSQDELIPNIFTPMSEDEVQAHVNPEPPAPDPLTKDEVNALRRTAYANPITGSDPLYIEYQRDIATGEDDAAVQASREAWLGRAAEIAALYPWPVDSIEK